MADEIKSLSSKKWAMSSRNLKIGKLYHVVGYMYCVGPKRIFSGTWGWLQRSISLVVRRDIIRFLLAHVACTVIDLKQVDIKTAFLHGIATVTERFDRDIDVDMRRRSPGKILMRRSLTM